ncbi:MAG: HAMP domain-containing protein [Planctomycetaceae bacterium]|nr:HAMP domain-containing protein [Planctomycetaceae bacterium]
MSQHEPSSSTIAHLSDFVRLGLVAAAPVAAQIVGSAFNIWYNLTQVRPLLSETQHERLVETISVFNVSIYPAATVVWLWVVFRLRRPMCRMMAGENLDSQTRWRSRQRVINLPWWIAGIGAVAWMSCIPALIFSLHKLPEVLDERVSMHLAISILLGGMIAVTHGFFAVELISQRLLFPAFFADVQPSSTRGAFPLSLRGRGLMWAMSAGVCPIISLLLLHMMPEVNQQRAFLFPLAVGIVAIIFGLTTAWMLGRLYSEPVRELQRAARNVAEGNLQTKVEILRADEFGPLITEFNKMVAGLREGERLRQTFGLHVGREAARQILASDPGLGGVEQCLTVMFVDIRNFTASSGTRTPQEVVSILNEFLTEMVEIVEQEHGGMVNKYLGDGFMALFGAGDERADHADAALQAGADMLLRLRGLNDRFQQRRIAPLGIGIGIHTGLALVGSIGSASRLEFTAIGDTVNVASRVESVTKSVGVPLLITAATRQFLTREWKLVECEPQKVKGVVEPIVIFTLPPDS